MRFIRILICILGLSVMTGSSGMAIESALGPEDTAAIHAAIQGQLSAFQADDENRAWSFAAPHIHDMFKTPANFMDMVVSTYTIVYRHEKAVFLDLVATQGQIIQKVMFIAEDGAQALGLYHMQQQADGTWLIAGCVLARQPGEAV